MRFWIAGLLFLASTAHAGAIDSLRAFVRETQSARAQFSQVVLDRAGQPRQQAAGVMVFARPGRFRWTYDKPYEQVIVGDGAKLWVYDKDLEQVTVKPLGEALGSSPAALLAGDNEIEKFFTLREAGSRDGLAWLEAVPKSRDTAFEQIRMGFAGNGLRVMELKDSFGNRTVIRFEHLERNPRLDPQLFRFTPPKGVDVIGE
ncbi:outer membrane lipoprotein chaperone LolA [Thiobacter aerophilum]|uniref:Outer-membrane lipoprotein carrier protein n=1 Tax=Thiobacter aerophilum TaxID=3121275 RepID=A0ABV0EBR4_9BURK